MDDDKFVPPKIKMVECFDDVFRNIEEIADEDDHSALRHLLGDGVEHIGNFGIGAGLRLVKHLEDAAHLARTATRADEGFHFLIESDEPRTVTLFHEKIGERCGEVLRV